MTTSTPPRSPLVPRSPRQTHAETGRIVKVTLGYLPHAPFGSPYIIERITNEIAVVVSKEQPSLTRLAAGLGDTETKHVGDYLTEAQATDLLTEPGLEVTTVPAKE